jgi:hypothetical protein
MLAAVAGAYRDFDVLQYEAFSRAAPSAAAAPGRLNREATTSVAADRPTIGSGLCEMAAIPGGVAPEEAELLKTAWRNSLRQRHAAATVAGIIWCCE